MIADRLHVGEGQVRSTGHVAADPTNSKAATIRWSKHPSPPDVQGSLLEEEKAGATVRCSPMKSMRNRTLISHVSG